MPARPSAPPTPRPARCPNRNTTSSTSTCRRSPRCGGTARVIGSWLLDLTAGALKNDPTLKNFGGRVSDSGEGRWTLKAAIDTGVPAPVLSSALFDRFASQGESEFADKLLSAMRFAFGGHVEKKG